MKTTIEGYVVRNDKWSRSEVTPSIFLYGNPYGKSPGENGAICECGCKEFAPLENKWSNYDIEQLMLVYLELSESSNYEDRLRAEGFIKALQVLI